MWDNIKQIIGKVAPAVATIIGTPMSGIVVNGLCKILGLNSSAKSTEIEAALSKATPDQWLAIKKLESDTIIKLKELDINLAEIEAQDRDSARQREVNMAKTGKRDILAPLIGISVTVGFFSLLYILAFYNVQNKEILDVMLGVLGAAFMRVVGYIFGSSRGSKGKDNAIGNLLNKRG